MTRSQPAASALPGAADRRAPAYTAHIESPRASRITHFDGLRGFAALAVVLHHFYLLFYVSIDAPLNSYLLQSPLMIALNGGLAVYVFFVLSGYVLSAKYFSTGDARVTLKMAAARYPRLAIPAFAALAVATIAVRSGWFEQYLNTARIFDAHAFGPSAWMSAPSVGEAVRAGLVGIFFNSGAGAASPDPPLWTMYVEFAGSFMVFGLCLALRNTALRMLSYSLLTLVIGGCGRTIQAFVGIEPDYLIAFVVGMAYADVTNSPVLRATASLASRSRPMLLSVVVVLTLLAAQLSAVAYIMPELRAPLTPIYGRLARTYLAYNSLLNTVTAALIVILANESRVLRSWLSSAAGFFFGKISFALYLVHWTVMVTIACFVFLRLYAATGNYAVSAACASVCGLVLSILAAFIFERAIDAPAIKVSRTFGAGLVDAFFRQGTDLPAATAELPSPRATI
ncbi:MAG TPA: acyltransferase [Caulobacteraceae bacterium]